jgi:methyl-accepting chemotaxis protein
MKIGILPRILIPVVAAVALVTATTTWITDALVGERLEVDAEALLAISADGQALRLAEWIGVARRELITWSHEPGVVLAAGSGIASPSCQAASERFAQLVKDNNDYDAIHIVDRTGLVTASSAVDSIGKLQVIDRPYIKEALAGQIALSDGFPSRRTGRPVVALAVPIRRDHDVVGALYTVIDLGFISKGVIAGTHAGFDGCAILYDGNGMCISHPLENLIFKPESSLARLPFGSTLRTASSGTVFYQDDGQLKLAAVRVVAGTSWRLCNSMSLSDVQRPNQQLRSIILALAGGALALITLLVTVIAHSISRPLRRAVAILKAVAGGDLTAPPPLDGAAEVVGMGMALTTALAGMRAAFATDRIDWGDIGRQTAARRELVERLVAASAGLSATGRTLSTAAEEASSQAVAVSASSEEVSASVRTVAAGTEQLSAAISEIARSTTDALRISLEAVHSAEDASGLMDRLGLGSIRIGEVVESISGIAEQTNLLALNATIEAARAGDAGRGFAVVASEVKSLAQQTATATSDIQSRIGEIRRDIAASVVAIRGVAERIKEAGGFQTIVASAVEEQAATTREISGSIREAAKGTGDIANAIQSVAKTAGQASKAAEDTGLAADDLARMAAQLRG